MIRVFENLQEAKKNKVAYFHKNLFPEVPSWDEFLKCIFDQVQIPNPELEKNMVFGTDVNEKPVGNVIVTDDVYYSPQTTELHKYFVKMNDSMNEFKKINDMDFGLSGAKISVGPRYVAPHHDNWDAFTVQCQGTTIWTISNDDGSYQEKFFMEPGDFLFFPQETKHELYCEEPRAGLIFNFPQDDTNAIIRE
jgi:quercetin dioxygenase-like cupin family protein